ncbi:MAG: hypothetical protein KUL87_07255 [Pseudomonas sp.]|jgi:hypothetical protein|nr:hypothetical protein [Pseudomonas sp.]
MSIAPSLMTVTSRITAQAALPEHPDNGVERGFVDTQAIVFAARRLDELASRWPESRYLNVAVLRALLSLVQRDPERAQVGFDAWEVAAAIRDEYVRGWAASDLREEVAAKVREHWQKLTGQTWPKKEEGVRQHLQDAGIEFIPVLYRDEGGGQGNPTRYCFALQSFEAEDLRVDERSAFEQADCQVSDVSASASPARQQISYICEDVEDASWLARTFAQGFQLAGWRRHAFRGVLLVGILIVGLTALLVPLTVFVSKSVSGIANAAFAAVVFGYVFWATLGTLLMLHRWRVALAPWWMQSVDDDRLVEWRCPPRHPVKSIKAVRYTAECPLCGGKVVARSGGLMHAWAIVGRCEEAPAAHVFSFDHVRREGVRKM